MRFEYKIIQQFDLHTPIQDHASSQMYRIILKYSDSINLSIKKLKKLNYLASRTSTSSFSSSSTSLPISKSPNESDEKDQTNTMNDLFTPLYNIFQWNEAPYTNLHPNRTPIDKQNKKSSDNLDNNQNIPKDNLKNENSDNNTTISTMECNNDNTLNRQLNSEISLNTENQETVSQEYFPSSLTSELSREIFQYFCNFSKSNGNSKSNSNNWILDCCNNLIPLCYIGKGSGIIQNKNPG